jgi:hypothetical protein
LHQSPLFITENKGKEQQLIGLSLPTVTQTGGWIRDYLTSDSVGFDFEQSQAEPFQLQTFGRPSEQETRSTTILLSDGQASLYSTTCRKRWR